MAQAQIGNGQRATSSSSVFGASASSATATVRTLHGQVINALNGVAVPRALVNVNSRQVLTDSQGRFELRQFTDQQASVTVSKPGYSQSSDAAETFLQHRIADLDAPVEVKLYPDALVTGIVSGSDGLPLSQVQVFLKRANYDMSGVRWVNAGFSMTNSRGEYRFLTPGGRYRIGIGYNTHTRETGEALLPLTFPESSSSSQSGYLTIASGDEKQINLSPRMGEAYAVLIRVEQPDVRSNMRLTAVAENGESMNLGFSNGNSPGEYRIELPSGSYMIRGQSDNRDEALEGAVRVTVAGRAVSGVTMHMTRGASLPVEVAVNPASTTQNVPQRGSASSTNPVIYAPNLQQFNLYLHNLAETGDGINQDVPARPREDKVYEFRPPPGRYRLAGNGGGNWYVESATYGGITNLLTSDIVIAAGSAGAPIRVVANNQRGNVHGQVTLPATLANAWVYLFPKQPALAPPNPLSTGTDGSFYASLPVGSYLAVAFDHRVQEDLRDPEVVERLTAGAKTVDVTAGGDSTVTVEVSQVKEIVR